MKSILFVPGDREDLARKAAIGSASSICLDLEDGVSPSNKNDARGNISELLVICSKVQKKIGVRINSEFEEISHDLDALNSELDFILLPKTGSRHQICLLSETLDRLFGSEGPKIIAMLETAGGLSSLTNGTGPLPDRLTHVALGTEDLAMELETVTDGPLIRHAFEKLALFAAEWQKNLLGYPGSIAEIKDTERFKYFVQEGHEIGAVGGFAIHPKQVEILNQVYSFSDEVLEDARKIVHAFDEAVASGKGAIKLDGRMIDKPVYLAAQKLLQKA